METAAKVSGQRFALDGYYINMKAYLIGGNNYVKLRDIALQINFGVGYDNESGRVTIYPACSTARSLQAVQSAWAAAPM